MDLDKLTKAAQDAARYEHRRRRLEELVATLEANGAKRAWLATAIKRTESYVTRLLVPADSRHRKNLGDVLMTSFTEALDLSPGWFDLPLGSDLPTTTKIGPDGTVVTPGGTRPAPAHTKLPFERQLVDRIIDLPDRWLGRVEQAMIEVLREYERQGGDEPQPSDALPAGKPKKRNSPLAGKRRMK